MRLNPIILAASLLVGVAGLVFTVRAYTTYNDAAEAFTRIELHYIPGSFQWEDPEFDEGTARFRIVNDSRFDASVGNFDITLQFDGRFAGSDYTDWQPITVPGGETRDVPVHFLVTANSIQAEGGTSDLQFAGQLLVDFDEFEQRLSFRFRGDIGRATYGRQ